jgi:hypothetical protein
MSWDCVRMSTLVIEKIVMVEVVWRNEMKVNDYWKIPDALEMSIRDDQVVGNISLISVTGCRGSHLYVEAIWIRKTRRGPMWIYHP